jgi:hypothetical protein
MWTRTKAVYDQLGNRLLLLVLYLLPKAAMLRKGNAIGASKMDMLLANVEVESRVG